MPSILIVDHYYPQFLKSWDFNPAASYESEQKRLLEFSFGTGDFYSRTLKWMGWETADVIANAPMPEAADLGFVPNVVFLQNLSINVPITANKEGRLIAGQCSCPWPGDHNIRKCDVVFSSFPHYVPRIEALGVKAVYNPLAFDPIVLDRVGGGGGERSHDCVFIGGVGNPSHWKKGMETLEAIAKEIPTFKWWGYGYDTLPSDSALRDKYQGEAWGLDMYRILLQSKIVVNRHGEVAENHTNNMRCFEATGCGALLLTERSKNLHEFFSSTEAVAYSGPEEAVFAIRGFLGNEPLRKQIAEGGRMRTLRDHTYAQRMQVVSSTLMDMVGVPAK